MMLIEPLNQGHRRSEFDCGKRSVNSFLRGANVLDATSGLTLVATDPRYPLYVVGFVSLAIGNISWEGLTSSELHELMQTCSLKQMALLHFIGVDREVHGRGVARQLVQYATTIARTYFDKPPIALLAEAVYEDTRPVFPRLGFVPLGEDSTWMLMRL